MKRRVTVNTFTVVLIKQKARDGISIIINTMIEVLKDMIIQLMITKLCIHDRNFFLKMPESTTQNFSHGTLVHFLLFYTKTPRAIHIVGVNIQ